MTSKTVLLVDDESIILLSLKQSLVLRFGSSYAFETAKNAEEGLLCIEKLVGAGVEVVLVLSDWLMPGMKGDEFLRKIHTRWPMIKLIMISGHVDDTEMAHLLTEVELHAFLRKPWNTKSLIQLVESALG